MKIIIKLYENFSPLKAQTQAHIYQITYNCNALNSSPTLSFYLWKHLGNPQSLLVRGVLCFCLGLPTMVFAIIHNGKVICLCDRLLACISTGACHLNVLSMKSYVTFKETRYDMIYTQPKCQICCELLLQPRKQKTSNVLSKISFGIPAKSLLSVILNQSSSYS